MGKSMVSCKFSLKPIHWYSHPNVCKSMVSKVGTGWRQSFLLKTSVLPSSVLLLNHHRGFTIFLGDWTKANRNHQAGSIYCRARHVFDVPSGCGGRFETMINFWKMTCWKIGSCATNRDGTFFHLTYDTYVTNKSFNFILYMTLLILDTWHFF